MGPEGFLPMQKYAFGWLGESSFMNLVPGVTYRLRTLREGTLTNSTYPSALVWKDRVYDSEVWFSFYQSDGVFDTDYEDLEGSNAHGNGLGFAYHIPTTQRTGSLRVGTFGRSFTHHSGLVFTQ